MNKTLITSLLALAIGGMTAQSAVAGGPIDFRESTMTIYKWYLKPMAGMVKGKVPFNVEAFQKNAQGLALATRLDLLSGFPKGSYDPEESRAKKAIWEEWPQFEDKYRALQKESSKLAEVAMTGDVAAMKAQFGATAKTCGGCHKPFRAKK